MKKPNIGFKPVPFHNDPRKFAIWDGQPARAPKRGDLYLSGAIAEAYLAGADMTTEYFIAVPMRRQGESKC